MFGSGIGAEIIVQRFSSGLHQHGVHLKDCGNSCREVKNVNVMTQRIIVTTTTVSYTRVRLLRSSLPSGSLFLESMFIDQATHNGTRPNSPVGDEPATTPSGPLRYGSTPWMGPTPEDLSVTGFVRWPSVSLRLVKKIVGWVISSAGGIAFQSLVDAMSSVRK